MHVPAHQEHRQVQQHAARDGDHAGGESQQSAAVGEHARTEAFALANAAAAPNRPGCGWVITLTGISSIIRSKRPLAMKRSRKPERGR